MVKTYVYGYWEKGYVYKRRCNVIFKKVNLINLNFACSYKTFVMFVYGMEKNMKVLYLI